MAGGNAASQPAPRVACAREEGLSVKWALDREAPRLLLFARSSKVGTGSGGAVEWLGLLVILWRGIVGCGTSLGDAVPAQIRIYLYIT